MLVAPLAASAAAPAAEEKAPAETETGIPVTDQLVIRKCGTCHLPDEKHNLSRISWIRTTPEGWSQAIKRMVRQNGLQITPEEVRSVIKYLAGHHGLAPEEAKPVMYIAERRIQDETNIPNDAVRGACTTCHAFGQPLSWRRSKQEWQHLQDLHVALYAQADVWYRRPAPAAEGEGAGMGAAAAPGAPPAKPRTQGQVALEYIQKAAPLSTPEWAAWQSRMQTPHLAGRWLVSAHALGQGNFVGEMVVEAGPAVDEFKTSVTLRSLKDGSTLKRTGAGLVYAGYSWRGRSSGQVPQGMHPDNRPDDAREVMWFSPDQSSAEGRWFWGDYQEFGFDVKLVRASGAPAMIAVEPAGLKAGEKSARLRIIGDNLPKAAAAADIHLGAGLTVSRIVSQSPTELVAEVTVAPDAASGMRDVQILGSALQNAFAVYHRVDYLKVVPDSAIARLGSTSHPKGYQQFEAVGFENGLDGKPGTADDLRVGSIDVKWSVEEFMTTFTDDDKKFVGQLSPTALFTPASDGPNPARRFGRNNYGDVWVTATAKSEKDRFGKPLTGRSYLVVAVPMYLRWDQPEISQ